MAGKSERVNVVLGQDAVEAMERLQERTDMKKVDVINRGIVLLEFVEEELRQGREVLVHDSRRPGEPGQRMKLFFQWSYTLRHS